MLQTRKYFLSVVWLFLSSITSISIAAQDTACDYQIISEWDQGYTATITLSNQSITTVTGWSLHLEYYENRISNLWNAALSGDNPYTISALSWNQTLPPGASTQFGFQVDKNGRIAEYPRINGDICSDATSSSAVSSSSAPAQCNWYGNDYPFCEEISHGWGWENGQRCISRVTCHPDSCDTIPAPPHCYSSSSKSSSSLNSSLSNYSSSVCPFTGYECVSNGSWKYICDPGCDRQGTAPCIPINICGNSSSLSSASASSVSMTSSNRSSSHSSETSSSSPYCPITGYECITRNGSWHYYCSEGCDHQGGRWCVPRCECDTSILGQQFLGYGCPNSSSSASAASAVSANSYSSTNSSIVD